MQTLGPNFALRDGVGIVAVLLVVVALTAVAFVTHAGPFILIGLLILMFFWLLRYFRERGRASEAEEVEEALHSRLHKGEKLLACTVGDRRRFKPLATLADFVLMMFSQGLVAGRAGALATDDTFVGLTDRRVIALDRQKRPPDQQRGWRERLNLSRVNTARGKHAVVFEMPCKGVELSVRLAVFYLALLSVRASDGRRFSVGLNSRFWAERAVEMADLTK